MIYLVTLGTLTDPDPSNPKFLQLLKIGYTKEPSGSARFSNYRNVTDTWVITTIKEGTLEDEQRLHLYFKKYRIKGREWYTYHPDIISFFETYTTIKEIRNQLPPLPPISLTKTEMERREYLFNPILYHLIESGIIELVEGDEAKTIEDFHTLLVTHSIDDPSKLFPFLSNYYDPTKIEEAKDWYNNVYSSKEFSSISSALESFKSLGNYDDKMKYLCDIRETLDDKNFNLFLNSIPASFKHYYTVLGPEKCKAHKYRRKDMEIEYQRLLNNQGVVDLDVRIYNTFHEGDRIRKKEIKEKLGKIYADSGYDSPARAIDLRNWFELKEIQFRVKGTNIRECGFELVRRKKP